MDTMGYSCLGDLRVELFRDRHFGRFRVLGLHVRSTHLTCLGLHVHLDVIRVVTTEER